MTRKIVVSLILCAAFIYAGIVVFQKYTSEDNTPAQTGKKGKALAVEVSEIEPKDVRETLIGFGTASAFREAQISSEVSGRIVERMEGLRNGSIVSEGDLLVQIDPSDYEQERLRAEAGLAQAEADLARIAVDKENLQIKLDVARAELELANQEYSRIEQLLSRGVASQADLDSQRLKKQTYERAVLDLDRQIAVCEPQTQAARALVETKKADLEKSRLNLERTKIFAPFEGIVSDMAVEVGELIRAGEPILRLVDLSRLELAVELGASKIDSVKLGAEAKIYMEDSVHPIAEAHVERISPKIDQRSRTFSVYLVIDNPNPESGILRPGMFLKALIDGNFYPNAITVPRSVFVGETLYVVENGVAEEKRPVVVSAVGDDRLISEGLEPGDLIITSNLEVMFDGRPVVYGEAALLQEQGQVAAAKSPGAQPPASSPVTPGAHAAEAPSKQPGVSASSPSAPAAAGR